MEIYEKMEKLGDGTYGTVIKALNKSANEIVAIKMMKRGYNNWEDVINLKEVKVLLSLRHPNIISLNEVILNKNNQQFFMIFEYFGTNLYEFLIKRPKELTELEIRNIVYQMLQGVAYMHKQNIFHRDMKPENILIEKGSVKITDFGLAKEIRGIPGILHTDYVATRWYRAPEVLLKATNYGSEIDIFAIGAIMAELYTKKPLFPGRNEHDQLIKICDLIGSPTEADWSEGHQLATRLKFRFPSNTRNRLSDNVYGASQQALNLMEQMLQINPNKRPSANQCLLHPFFQCNEHIFNESIKHLNINYEKEEKDYIKKSTSSAKVSKKSSLTIEKSRMISGKYRTKDKLQDLLKFQ